MKKSTNVEAAASAAGAPGPVTSPLRVLYAEATYDDREIEAVVQTLRQRRHQLMNGPAVVELEARVAKLFGKKYGVMTNSGSSALTLALAALELPSGSEVITPACTFATTVAPIVQQNLVPAFVDVVIDSFQIDPDGIEELITPRTKAMMVPNLIGNLPDWPRLRAIADAHQLHVIEDSADTIGSLIDGAPTGALSDASTTSFYASHVITCCGFGGMACFSRPDLARRAQLLRGWGRRSALTGETERVEDRFFDSVDGIDYDAKFIFDGVGYNFLPSEIGAAFGLEQLKKLESYIAARGHNFARLRTFFEAYEEWLVLPRQMANVRTAWLALPLIVRDSAPFSRRDLQMHFESAGVQTRPIFSGNILRHHGFSKIPSRVSERGYANADQVMRGGILLGCHQGMTEPDTNYICEVFQQLVRRY